MRKDETMPEGKWKFDGEVTDAFDNMLERSIPQYDVMRQAATDMAFCFVRPRSNVIDIGCSRGEALALMMQETKGIIPNVGYYGIEMSSPMLKAASDRFKDDNSVCILDHDLRKGLPVIGASVVLSILTIQFVPIEYRPHLLQSIYDNLQKGDAFIMVEKVLGNTAKIDRCMTDIYYAMKKSNGYTEEQILRKKLSLEGVLVPVTAEWNIDLLKSAGFSQIDCFWRWMNFAGWVAIK